jgi:NAD(P)-dependent dehydrogenase (short-subunit alcohol dehydrogenase family)
LANQHLSASLEGQAAIITGAANGLGHAIAREFAASGARLLLVDIDPAVSLRAAEIDPTENRVFALVTDLSETRAAQRILRTGAEKLGHVDIVVNNAAWSLHKPLLEMTTEDFDRLTAINQRAPYFLAQEFLRHVSESRARPKDAAILNIASVNAIAGNANLVAYAGTKGAMIAMTRAMAVEMASQGIRVNCISPSTIDTPAARKVVAEGKITMEELLDKCLVKRFINPEEVAKLAAYLCSSAAACVTGANWVIDCGYTAH